MRTIFAHAKVQASSRLAIFLAASAILCAAATVAPQGPRFSDYPFDEWAAAPEHPAIRWEVHLLPPELSVHQRLIERTRTVVPGSELANRRGRGELVLLVRYEDAAGHQWRAASHMSLVNIQQGVKSDELTFSLAAFVKPGDYKILFALVDTQTKEHSFTRRALHVAPLKSDPLPQSWVNLPPVEILPSVDGPDAWFLPAVKSLLHLPLVADNNIAPGAMDEPQGANSMLGKPVRRTQKAGVDPIHIDLLINTTPSEWSPSPAGTLRRNMSVVIPALKVLSALNAKIRPPSAAVIDLTHHRIGYETANAATLDWNAVDKLLRETNPAIIDAKSLSTQSSMREFFAREVARRAQDSGPERWLIVLSGPVVFARQDETPPPVLAADSRRHIIYLRFTPGFGGGRGGPAAGLIPDVEIAPTQRVRGPMPGLGTVMPGGPGRGGGGRGDGPPTYQDDLERVLKPMGARIVSITNPEVFRKSLASLVEEMSAAD